MPLEAVNMQLPLQAHILTLGTEITSGEIVNSNAAWISQQLEALGVRVLSHVSVRDQAREIHRALEASRDASVLIVTGGLGPTSDDVTRQCMAEFADVPLEFDETVWLALRDLHASRNVPIRESHRHQCHFPQESQRLQNPVGSALGFYQKIEDRHYFVLPGPPRELEGMWKVGVLPRLQHIVAHAGSPLEWIRWTCLGAPESEIAELVERAIELSGIEDTEVGYRAALPYVKVKLFLNLAEPRHVQLRDEVDRMLAPFLIGVGDVDLADELLARWPTHTLCVSDLLTGNRLAARLFKARDSRISRGLTAPLLQFVLGSVPGQSTDLATSPFDWDLRERGGGFETAIKLQDRWRREVQTLPFKIDPATERGRTSIAEWSMWWVVRNLRA